MIEQLVFTACLTGISVFYGSLPPPSTFLLTAYIIGILWIPFLAILMLISPGEAALIRTPSGDWEPRGLCLARAVIMVAVAFCLSRNMDLAAEVTNSLTADFDIYLAPHTRFSFTHTAMMCAASVLALELGKGASLWLVPILQQHGLLEWDAQNVEQTEEIERRLDEWSIRPVMERFW